MNRYRGPTQSGPSKATASTLCQKCLKRDIYECKAEAQQRPYVSRPSRTQQLLNPKLMPRLSSDIPNKLLEKKGITDEVLGNGSQKRGRDTDEEFGTTRKRSRSLSSFSSISTISTGRSVSPRRYEREDDRYHTSQRSPHAFSAQSTKNRKRRRPSSSSSRSNASQSSTDRMGRPRSEERVSRPRREFLSPDERGRRRSRSSEKHDGKQRNKSKSTSLGRSQIARHRLSLTPEHYGSHHDQDSNAKHRANGSYNTHNKNYQRNETGDKQSDRPRDGFRRDGNRHPSPPRQRSLSPFSKRLALTQAMNMGR